MENSKNYIASGILELFVLGIATQQENEKVQEMLHLHKAVRIEVEQIASALQQYAITNITVPNPTIKSTLFSLINADNSQMI